MKEWSLIILTVLLLVTIVGHGESLNANVKDIPHFKTVDLLRKVDPSGGYSIEKVASEDGGVHSGGGNLVVTSEGTGLLDLYLYNRQAFSSKEKGHVLAETKAFKNFGIELLGKNNMPLIKKTLAQIEKWEKSSPFVTSLLRGSVVGLPMYYVDYRLGYEDQLAYVPPGSGLKPTDMRLAAFYLADFGCFVDKKSFDSLSEKNQMALIIHETFRQEQLSFQYELSNEGIQKLTAAILSDPVAGETLDDEKFFGNGLPKGLEQELSLIERSQIIVEEYCSVMQSNCELDPIRLTVTDKSLQKYPSSKLSGQALVYSMFNNLLKYRQMHTFQSDQEKSRVQVLLILVALQISSLNTKEHGEEFRSKGRDTDMSLTKSVQGTNSLDHYLWYYNKERTMDDFLVMNFEGNANVKRFMQEMIAAGYFK